MSYQPDTTESGTSRLLAGHVLAELIHEESSEAPQTLLITARHDSRLPDLGARLETDELGKTQPAQDP